MSAEMTRTVLAAAVLVVTLFAVGVAGRLEHNRDVLVALGRAVVQLTAVGLVIRLVIVRPAFAVPYLLVMLLAAGWTSSRRIRRLDAAFLNSTLAIGLGAVVVICVVLATGALPRESRDLVPFAAQILGGAMTATTLAATRARDDVLAGWDGVEAALALGATPRQAVADVARRSSSRALVPALDQTRNVGLVVLPGAYVGLLLGGASPAEAGRVQFLVLLGLLVAESLAAVLVTRLLSDSLGRWKPL
jgi:putative ABC transport system permease protein